MAALGLWRGWAFAGLLMAFALPARGDETAQAITRQQTFVVQSMIDDRTAGIGSGVVVARDGDVLTLVTAAHVVSKGSKLQILDSSRRAYYDVVDTRVLPAYDLAFVRVRAQKLSPVDAVAFAPAASGESVWMWGNPGHSFWTLSTGTVNDTGAKLPGEEGGSRITITCDACTFGDSGSGVFDSSGKLIGILTNRWSKPGGPTLFLEVAPIAVVQRELDMQSSTAKTEPSPRP